MNIFTLSKAPLYLLISLFLPTMAMAIDPPERELSICPENELPSVP